MSQGSVKSVFVDFESGSLIGFSAIFSVPMENPKLFIFWKCAENEVDYFVSLSFFINLFSFYEKIAIFLFFRFNFPTVPIFFPRYWIFFRGLKFFSRCPIPALWVRTIIWMKFSIQKEKKIFFKYTAKKA